MNRNQSKELFDRSLKISPGGVHSPVRAFRGVGGPPVFVKSASGSTFEDVDGNSYVDFCQSWGPLLFGHRDPEVEEAVSQALSRGWSFGTAEPYSLELAELMVSKISFLEKVRFVNSGTEATMSAIRVARGHTQRAKILKFDGCYHGHGDSCLVRAGSGLAEMAEPDSAGVPSEIASQTLVCPLDDDEKLEAFFDRHGSEIAATIIEPLPANFGLLIQRTEFLEKLARLTRKAGALLIFDEVISGFRLAFGGMAEKTGIDPDLVTYGKVIGGGFPVGAYGGRSDIMDQVAPSGSVYQAGTLSANPVAMCAGLAMLKKILRDDPYTKLETMGGYLAHEVQTRSSLRVSQIGSLFWIFSGESSDSPRSIDQIPKRQKDDFPKLFHTLLDRGFYLAPSAFEVGFLSTSHAREQIERLIDAICNAVGKTQNA